MSRWRLPRPRVWSQTDKHFKQETNKHQKVLENWFNLGPLQYFDKLYTINIENNQSHEFEFLILNTQGPQDCAIKYMDLKKFKIRKEI